MATWYGHPTGADINQVVVTMARGDGYGWGSVARLSSEKRGEDGGAQRHDMAAMEWLWQRGEEPAEVGVGYGYTVATWSVRRKKCESVRIAQQGRC
ncbi:hypothetical protein L1987_53409 [Smallanthus sonchifolius]|uniref:Uncharacterized protein n=1 Tax=Smallanthus sonchifolius TaxID=185202 RepID=A0ACB9EVR9_9ASTR|nr:hypothetical protein L1987_53409 [Smallanthus sonchifolius]